MSKPEDYLKQNVQGIMKPMVEDILSNNPEDPVT
jgi:hypothetical protein